VEKREGVAYHKDYEIYVVDLPGIYTLGSKSLDEQIARDYLLFEAPDVVVVVVDALNPEQGLYLLLQVLELRGDVILNLNAVDESKKAGVNIDVKELSKHTGVHVVETVAVTGEGVPKLLDTIVHVYETRPVHSSVFFNYGEKVEFWIQKISSMLDCSRNFPGRWLAIRFIENDELVNRVCEKLPSIDTELRKELSLELATQRHKHINVMIREAYSGRNIRKRLPLDEAIDHVLTHRFLGIPIFLAIMYLVFQLTFEIAQPLADFIENGITHLADFITRSLGSGLISSFISEGLAEGVGAVVVFTPNIFLLFLAMGILEESGYLPRAAFVMDRIMYAMKLSGRSFVSLILGFGCNVPAILSTRSIPDPKERLITIMISPFVTCSARLPVYVLITGIFFSEKAGTMLFLIYTSSILITGVSALFLNRMLFKGSPVPLIMELPRYRRPTLKSLILYMWSKGKHFLQKAGTIILFASMIIWFLSTFPLGTSMEDSYAATLGKFVQPLLRPLGYDWKITTSLIFGMAAKEVVVSSLANLYGGQGRFMDNLARELDPITAFSLLFFIMAYVPCFATLAVVRSETGSTKWMIFTFIYGLAVAYILALMVKTLGGLLT